jgi:hypothetical protein
MKEMKRALWVAALVMGLSSLAEAGAVPAVTCSLGTLTTYLASGFSCTIGSVTFSNFGYSGTAFGGATAVPSDGITVTPLTDTESGFQFEAPWSASAGQGENSAITYTVTVSGGDIVDLVLSMAGFGVANGGDVSIGETSVTPPLSLLVFDNLMGMQTSDTITGLSLTSLTLVKNIAVSGNNGVATLSIVDNEFSFTLTHSRTPEPASILLFGAGLVAVAGYFRRRHASKS